MPENNNQNLGSDTNANPADTQGIPGIDLSKPAFDNIQGNGSQPVQSQEPINRTPEAIQKTPAQNQNYFSGNEAGGDGNGDITPPSNEMQNSNARPPNNSSILKPVIIIISIVIFIALITFGVMYYLNSSTNNDTELDSFFEEEVIVEEDIVEETLTEEDTTTLEDENSTLDVESSGGSVTGGDLEEETIETPEPDPIIPDENDAVEASG